MLEVETETSPTHIPAFRLYLLGWVVSLSGSAMAPIALAFAVLDRSGKILDLGIILAARSVPSVLFIVIGGAIADRFPRKVVLLISNYGAACTQAAAAIVLISGSFDVPVIAILEFCNGTLAAFTSPALRGIVPQLVPQSVIQKANSITSSSRSAIAIMGPTLAGLVVAEFGGGWALAFDSFTFLVAAVCFGRLQIAHHFKAAGTIIGDIRDGWSFFISITWVWVIVVTFSLMNFIQAGVWNTLGPVIAKSHIGEGAWGATLSAKALGLLIIGLVLYRFSVRRALVVGQWSVALGALPLLGLGLLFNTYAMMATAFLAGIGSGMFGILWSTALQSRVPNEMLSRVSSYDDLGSFVGVPLGQLAVGPIAAAAGLKSVAVVGAAGYAVLALVPLLIPAVRRMTLSKDGVTD